MKYSISHEAHAKVLLHALRYPHAAVNGILLGRRPSESIEIEDALALFHTQLCVSGLLEAALAQAESYGKARGLEVVGLYHANEHGKDAGLGPLPRRMGNAVCGRRGQDKACLLLLDNAALAGALKDGGAPAVRCWARAQGSWKDGGAPELAAPAAGESSLKVAVAEGRQAMLGDFDEHLEDPMVDWCNAALLR